MKVKFYHPRPQKFPGETLEYIIACYIRQKFCFDL